MDNNKKEEEKLRGRAGVMAKYKAANPDVTEDPTDEQLWEYAGNDYDELKSSRNKVVEGNKGLQEYVAKDPRFGAAIGMSFGDGDDKIPFMQALGRLFGKDAFEDNEDFIKGVEEFNKKHNDTLAEQEQANRNFEELTIPRLEQYQKGNDVDDEMMGKIGTVLVTMAEGLLMGDISLELIELAHKGITRDQDVQDAADTGVVEGRNEKIRVEKKNFEEQEPLPSLNNATGAGKVPVKKHEEKGSYYDEMEEVQV